MDRRHIRKFCLLCFADGYGLPDHCSILQNMVDRPQNSKEQGKQPTKYQQSSHIDAYKFSFLPRTMTDWNALPASSRAKHSPDSFKKALHKFPDTPADRCLAVPLQQ